MRILSDALPPELFCGRGDWLVRGGRGAGVAGVDEAASARTRVEEAKVRVKARMATALLGIDALIVDSMVEVSDGEKKVNVQVVEGE